MWWKWGFSVDKLKGNNFRLWHKVAGLQRTPFFHNSGASWEYLCKYVQFTCVHVCDVTSAQPTEVRLPSYMYMYHPPNPGSFCLHVHPSCSCTHPIHIGMKTAVFLIPMQFLIFDWPQVRTYMYMYVHVYTVDVCTFWCMYRSTLAFL